MLDFLGSLISGGANLLGGLLGQSSARKTAQSNLAAQYDFAKHGIQWRVEDAKAAGINPLAALGAQTSSFSNVVGDNSLGAGVGAMGQDISRAAASLARREERELLAKHEALNIENKGLQNDILRMEIASKAARLAAPGTGPGTASGKDWPIVVPQPRPKVQDEKLERQVRLFGRTFLNDPHTSDANTVEQSLGEGVSDWIWPLFKIPSMLWYNRPPKGKGGSSKFFRVGN